MTFCGMRAGSEVGRMDNGRMFRDGVRFRKEACRSSPRCGFSLELCASFTCAPSRPTAYNVSGELTNPRLSRQQKNLFWERVAAGERLCVRPRQRIVE